MSFEQWKAYARAWLPCALVRAGKTAVQTAAALIGTNATGVTDVDWAAAASAALLSGVVSLLMSMSGLPEVGEPEIEEG